MSEGLSRLSAIPSTTWRDAMVDTGTSSRVTDVRLDAPYAVALADSTGEINHENSVQRGARRDHDYGP